MNLENFKSKVIADIMQQEHLSEDDHDSIIYQNFDSMAISNSTSYFATVIVKTYSYKLKRYCVQLYKGQYSEDYGYRLHNHVFNTDMVDAIKELR